MWNKCTYLHLKFIIYLYVYSSAYVGVKEHGGGWLLSSLYHVGPWDPVQVVKFGSKPLYLLSHLASHVCLLDHSFIHSFIHFVMLETEPIDSHLLCKHFSTEPHP